VPATAATAFVGIKCTSLKFLSGAPPDGYSVLDGAVVALGGCDGNTGGGGSFTFWVRQHQTITWANGQTTTLSRAYGSTFDGPETDPDAGCNEARVTGVVKADTTGSATVPGNYHYELCGAQFPGVPPFLEPGSNVKIG
jgi:hypothetical protein